MDERSYPSVCHTFLPYSFINQHSDKLWMGSEKIQTEVNNHKRIEVEAIFETVMPEKAIATKIASYYV